MASRTTSLAAVFPSVDNDILELQFAVVKKRNVKNKDKKNSKKALPTGKGGESLNCIVQLEESELSTNLIFAGKYFCFKPSYAGKDTRL